MKKPHRRLNSSFPKRWRKSLWVVPGIGLLVKAIVISQIPGNAWLGADGENYLQGLDFLIRDGFLSEERILHYWPAGYPLMMWTAGAIAPQFTLPIMAILQSLFYGFATAFFSEKINQSSLKKYALPSAILLTISPTLTLNTIAIGYELISASVFLITLGIFISLHQISPTRLLDKRIFILGLLLSINNFVQPRFLLSSLIIFIAIGFFFFSRKLLSHVVIIGMILSFLLPSILIFRNVNANDFASISTNLGVTMRIGAGDGASGAYVPSFTGVDCPETKGNAAEVDQAIVRCTIEWYIDNPVDAFRLAVNKSIFFWSPWFGPLASGSMARNPWLKINPFYDLATESQEGFEFVFGTIGKVVSTIWMLLYFGLMVFGLLRLRGFGDLGQRLFIVISLLVSSNWLISLGTLGDHRQRLPILSLMIFLQVVALLEVRNKKSVKPKRQRKVS